MTRKEVNSKTIYEIFETLKNRFDYYNNIIVSCCFNKSKILSYGISKPDIHIHSIGNNKQYAIHAEVDAINNYFAIYNNKLRKKIGKINILTIRISKKGELKTAKSCRFCIQSLSKIPNIQKIYYTDNEKIYCERFEHIYNNIDKLGISSGDRRYYRYNK